MRPLSLNDKCYKFFFSEAKLISGPGSISYRAHQSYSDKKLFFFRREEAISKLKNLLYFMEYGDTLAEIIVDKNLIESAVESSPYHFVTNHITIGDTYGFNSNELILLVIEALRNCSDFSMLYFRDIIVQLIKHRGFQSATTIFTTITTERNLELSNDDLNYIICFSVQPWRQTISISDIRNCKSFIDYIEYLQLHIS